MIRTHTMRTVMSAAATTAAAALLAVGGPAAAPAQAAAPARASEAAAPAPVAAAPGAARQEAADQEAANQEVQASTAAAEQVSTFVEKYRLAVEGLGGESPRQVREQYLSPYLNYRLDVWAQQNDADPVFRAQNVPTSWSATEVKEEEGFASVRLTEYWGGGGSQDVWYTVRLDDLRIFDLSDQPAF